MKNVGATDSVARFDAGGGVPPGNGKISFTVACSYIDDCNELTIFYHCYETNFASDHCEPGFSVCGNFPNPSL